MHGLDFGEEVTWYFTPSQPLRLYQGDIEEEEEVEQQQEQERERERERDRDRDRQTDRQTERQSEAGRINHQRMQKLERQTSWQ